MVFTALFPVSQAPLRVEDVTALGGDRAALSGDGSQGPAWIEIADDSTLTGRRDDATGITLFAGWVDSKSAQGQDRGPAAAITQLSAAFRAIGDATCRSFPGEWLWVRWDAKTRSLTLAASENALQPLYYASNGTSVAISTSLRRLARLPSLSGAFDTGGLLRSMGRTGIRGTLGNATLLEGVCVLPPGSVLDFAPDKGQSLRSAPHRPSLPKWTGSFEDAVVQTRGLLEEIVDEHLQRHESSAVMLSGGLDSSTLAWLLAERSGNPGAHIALSSAAPPGSGLTDESHYAEDLARALGLPFQRVIPAAEASPYRPTARAFAVAETPALSQRHYLYEALHQAAARNGASAAIDGIFGELSVTTKIGLPWHQAPFRHARRAAMSVLRRTSSEGPQDLFHIRLAAHQLADFTRADLGAEDVQEAAWSKAELVRTDTTIPNLQCAFPFRDKRLLELVATMPPEYHVNRALNRRLGRAILEGRIPETIRLRRSGMPFSPDYEARLRSHSAAAVDRIAEFRSAGADEWIDLDWLQGALLRVGRGEAESLRERLQAQLTAMTGEFIVWWRQTQS